MKNLLKFGALISLTLFALAFTSGESEGLQDCKILHEGTFTYGSTKDSIRVYIKGNKHRETHYNGKYTIESTLEWVSDCEYNTTLLSADLPNFPFEPGVVMNVKIVQIKGKEILYTATVNGNSWPGLFTKLE